MSRVAFKQCDVERLLRAAKAVGYLTPSVDILPDGGIRLLTTGEEKAPLSELEQWENKWSR